MLTIIGGGGHGSDTLELAHRCGVDVAGIRDDAESIGHRFSGRANHLGPIESCDLWTLGVGYPGGRRALAERLGEGVAPALVDPSAIIGTNVALGRGVAVFWLASLSPHVNVGAHSFVSYGATVGHDTQVGSFCSVMPGAHLSGNTTIGDGVLVGTGAIVLQGLAVGDEATIGAGAVVTKDVPAGATVLGVPAHCR